MGMNKVIIDVEARFTDNVSGSTGRAKKTIDEMGKAADSAQKKLDGLGEKKAKPIFDADDSRLVKKLRAAEHRMGNLGKHKTKVILEALDKATNVIGRVANAAQRLGRGAYSLILKAKDAGVFSAIAKANHAVKSLTGKAWSVAVKLKDMVTSPLAKIKNQLFSLKTLAAAVVGGVAANKFAIQPTQMYADYEDLVTQFGVLLGGRDKAEKRMADLVAFAGQTPFTRDEIFQASRVLQTYTQGALATPDSVGGLKMIGDIAAATGQEYSRVANYMGRLYNEVGRGGESLGEPLMMLREIGALSAESEEKIKKIATGSGDISTKWAAIAEQFSSTEGMMEAMSNQMNNLMLGVKSFLKNNLYMKLGEGISSQLKPFLVDFRTWRSENKDLIAGWAESVSNFAATMSEKVLGGVRKLASTADGIFRSQEFQDADWMGKAGMLWRGLVTDPLTQWWEGGGRARAAAAAGKIGGEMGKLLTAGLTGIFGATGILKDGEVFKEGAGVAESFVRGFLGNLDTGAITAAFKEALSNVASAAKGLWSDLPWWGKALVGSWGVSKLMPLFQGVGSLAKGAGSLIQGAGSLVSGGKSLLGKEGGVLSSLAQSAGTMHVTAGVVYLSGGESGGLDGLSDLGDLIDQGKSVVEDVRGAGGARSLLSRALPLLLKGGGILGGIAGVVTAGKGVYDAYQGYKAGDDTKMASGLTRVGTVGAGATVGALIGSIVPVIGTAVGAGIGAGVGAIAGHFTSKAIEDSAPQVVPLGDVVSKFKTATAEAAENLQEAAKADLAGRFGELKLTLTEIQRLADQVVYGKNQEAFEKYASAVSSASSSLAGLRTATESAEKYLWKAGLGGQFSEDERSNVQAAFDDYVSSAQKYAENQHYQLSAAVSLLLEPDSEAEKNILANQNAFYGQLQEQLEGLGGELSSKVKIALEDGVITLDEQAEITNLLNQINEITNRINTAQQEAQTEMLQLKFGDGRLSEDSYDSFREQMQSTLRERLETTEEAQIELLADLKLRYPEKGEAYEQELAALTEGYHARVKEAVVEVEGVEFQLLGDMYSEELGEDAAAKLSQALHDSLAQGIEPKEWTAEDANRLLGVDSLSDAAAQNIGAKLQDWLDFLRENGLEGEINPSLTVNPEITNDPAAAIQEQVPKELDADTTVNVAADAQVIGEDPTGQLLATVPDQVDANVLATVNAVFNTPNRFNADPITFGILNAYSYTTTASIAAGYSVPNKFSGDASTFGVKSSYSLSTKVSVLASITTKVVGSVKDAVQKATGGKPAYRGGIVGGSSALEAFARGGIAEPLIHGSGAEGFSDGGIVRGGARLIKVAEEGSPEMIIPLSSQRRERALKLWEKAGHYLDVPGFARGGETESSGPSLRSRAYAPDGESSGSQSVQVDMGGVTVQIRVDAGGSGGDVAQAIREQSGEIAETVAGILADALSGTFENTPLKGGAA